LHWGEWEKGHTVEGNKGDEVFYCGGGRSGVSDPGNKKERKEKEK